MSGNEQKTPLALTLNRFATQKAFDAIQLLGKALPASVTAVVSSGVVTVKFELKTKFTLPSVTVPLAGSEYVRLPVQVGMKGFVVPAAAYLGGVSGLGGGTADLSLRANLSTLVFFPIGNSDWTPSEDPNALVLYGPDGVIIRNLAGTSKLVLGPDGTVITPPAGKLVTVESALKATGNLDLGGSLKNAAGATYDKDINTSAGLGVGGDAVVGGGLTAAAIAAGTAAFNSGTVGGKAILSSGGAVTLTGGFKETEYDLGTPTNGATVTPDPLNGQFQKIANNVAGFSFAAPSLAAGLTCTLIVRVINGPSAGTITFPGMKQWPGAALDTTNGHQFVIVFYSWGGVATAYLVQQLSP